MGGFGVSFPSIVAVMNTAARFSGSVLAALALAILLLAPAPAACQAAESFLTAMGDQPHLTAAQVAMVQGERGHAWLRVPCMWLFRWFALLCRPGRTRVPWVALGGACRASRDDYWMGLFGVPTGSCIPGGALPPHGGSGGQLPWPCRARGWISNGQLSSGGLCQASTSNSNQKRAVWAGCLCSEPDRRSGGQRHGQTCCGEHVRQQRTALCRPPPLHCRPVDCRVRLPRLRQHGG